MGKKLTVFVVALGLLIAAVFATSYYFFHYLMNKPTDPSAPMIVYELKPGVSAHQMTKDLEQLGVWPKADLINLFLKVDKKLRKIKVGEYEVSAAMSPIQVLEIINSGKSKFHTVTIPEGHHIVDVADAVEKAGLATKEEFLKAIRDPQMIQKTLGENVPSLEGYLYPETYQFTKFMTTEDMLKAMVAQFKRVYAEVEAEIPVNERGARARTFTRHQMVTMASLVEKETGAPDERPIIASVFYNRLDKGMKLQTDPTILYGKFLTLGEMPLNISRADILAPTPYNTYVITGLPPGPICNPGKAALRAAFKPAVTKSLYFVSKNDGTHVFSETYEAHNRAVNFYQKDPKQREGKSWRDLNKSHK